MRPHTKQTLRRLTVLGAGIGGIIYRLSQLPPIECPNQFRTDIDHYNSARFVMQVCGEGIINQGEDLDFDNDDMNDLYIIGHKGTIFHTASRRLIQGDDNLQQRTWVKDTQDSLQYAKKGSYENPD